jgi:aminoglycoside phosphotransferase (APT) family kinase protein
MDLPGLDLDRLTTWMDAELPGLRQGQLSGNLLRGGKSNLTYQVTDGASAWVLRRPPLGHVLPTAHDMAREYRVISALRHTSVPVPAAVALCRDETVLGAPFYLMEFVDGLILDTPTALSPLSGQAATITGELLVGTLTCLHRLPPDDTGLGDLGRGSGYLGRQVSRWLRQWTASQTRAVPILEPVAAKLAATIPDGRRVVIVHGDYRLANMIFTSSIDAIAAVLDWEMATLGDPLTDLSLLMAYQALAAAGQCGLAPQPPAAGFLSPTVMAARYQRETGADLSRLDWYLAFSYFKLAVISETIRRRQLDGHSPGTKPAEVSDFAPELLHAAWQSLAHE